jgi:hypothetical protein
MKKMIFALAFIAVSLVSCTKDDANPTKDLKPKAAEFASATVDLKTENGSNPTGKVVNRGLLHAWISEIDITVTSNDFTYAPFMTPFTLTNAPVGAGVDATYNLDNVALGSNSFAVTTKTGSAQQCSFEQFATGGTGVNADATSRMTFLKTKDVYALYNASFNATIVHGANSLPSTMLTTTQGRACAVFQISPALTALGVTAKVTAAPSVTTSLPIITVDGGHDASFFWSNINAIGGTNVLYTVDLYDNNGHKFNTFTTTLNLVASTSVNNIYTINESDITTNTASDVFTAQPWDNQDGGGTIGN